MSEDKIQSTKETMYKFSKIRTLSDMEQTILRNGANAIEQLQQEKEQLKLTLKGTTHCFDEEEHQRLIKENKELKEKLDISETNYDIVYDYFTQINKLLGTELYNEVLDEILKLKRNNNTLTEFEKWLEEILEGYTDFSSGRAYMDVLEKLQELKEKNNATTN